MTLKQTMERCRNVIQGGVFLVNDDNQGGIDG